MKIKTSILPLFTVSTGVLGLIFRFWLNTAGTDKEGLVITNHPSVAMMFIIAAMTFGVLGFCAWGMDKTPRPFSRSVAGAIGCVIAGIGVLVSCFMEQAASSDIMAIVNLVIGLLAVPCFMYAGFCRFKGTSCPLIPHVVMILFFMVHLVLQYRIWCSVPQLQDYFFPLLGSVFLLLSSFHRASKDLKQSSEAAYLFFSQSALFCCMLSVTGSSWLFYAAMTLWTTLDLFPRKEQ